MERFKKIVRKTENKFDAVKFKVKDALNLFDPVIIYPYRGFANQNKAYLHGRVIEKESIIHDDNDHLPDNLWTNLKKTWKRYESDEVPGVEITGELHGFKTKTVSDKEGYFTLEFHGLDEQHMSNGWHEVQLEITNMPFDLEYEREAVGEVLVCEQDNPFGVISDVDDTIIVSNAMHSIKRIFTMMRNDAQSRTPFEGVANLYHALIHNYKNPLFFVSGSSYNLYDMLVAFCEHHNIPKAPFFLRDLGLDTEQWIKQDTMPYKVEYIEQILRAYPQLPFILIGDSGQEDPEIYKKIHEDNPGRIQAIYIRHVHHDERKEELLNMAKSLDIPFLVMDNSKDALDHAKKMGWA
ncbi:DUF2183 domain-containing protein [Fulvivirga sp. RKSG066]|uniref:App1 family protein n=1 Tax=Fulvivirga aurantia TaxID=2529383 RepID=UPI0012BCD202|nr:phosphatase domain-containing protein [Fulvivirga aurantia]MTI19638.1 DUF2183 domain-containing protein [Fulvivirga aurantia]